MKNTFKLFGVIAVALLISFVLVSCADNSPKGLAKQMYDLEQDWERAFNADDDKKMNQIEKKIDKLEERIDKLSDSDLLIYEVEYAKLAGFDIDIDTDSLFGSLNDAMNTLDSANRLLDSASNLTGTLNDAQNLLNATSNLLDTASNLTGTVNDAQNALNSANRLLESTSNMTGTMNDAQNALNEAQNALNALNSLGSFGF